MLAYGFNEAVSAQFKDMYGKTGVRLTLEDPQHCPDKDVEVKYILEVALLFSKIALLPLWTNFALSSALILLAHAQQSVLVLKRSE